MSDLIVESPRSYAHLHHGRLRIRAAEQSNSPCPEVVIETLDHVVINEDVQFSTQTLAALLREQVPMMLLDRHGRFLGSLQPPERPDGDLRIRQYRSSLNPDFQLVVGVELVSAKIANQRRLLQRLDGNRPGRLEGELEELERLRDAAERCGTLDSLRGFEGQASRIYFAAWARYLPSEFPFERRSTRPPRNAVNAFLSFGYTVVHQELVDRAQRRGLDAAIGFLHAPENGRSSLAFDLVEPFRPAIVEALAIRMFSHRMLRADDFEPHGAGVYLARSGRAKFFEQYHARMERRRFVSRTGRGTTMRAELENAILSIKRAIETGECPVAFRIP